MKTEMTHRFSRTLAVAILLPFLISPALLGQNEITGRIVGRVLDRTTQTTLPGANILVQETKLGAVTDADGRFTIEKVPVGNHLLRISILGYKAVLLTDVVVSTGHETQVEAQLEDEPVALGEAVTVTASAFYKPKDVTTSSYGMNYEEIRRQPGAAGDISRMIQTMPGVVPTNDQRNDLVVRGGSPGENLTVVDNVEVPNISHFGTQGASGGPINMLSAEFIREADFAAGGFPARFGDRLSSVLDIRLREGNRNAFAGTFDLGMAGAGFIVEGPLTQKGSWMAAVRKSYLDLIFKSFGLTAVPNYSNYQVKATYDPAPEHRLWLVSLGGIDDIHFGADQSKTDDPQVYDVSSSGWRTITGVNWRWLWGSSGYGTLCVSDVLNIYDQKATDPRVPGNPMVFHNNSREGETTVKYDAVLHVAFAEFSAGLSHKFLRATYDISNPTGEDNPYASDSTKIMRPPVLNTLWTGQSASYAQVAIPLTAWADLTLGFRWDHYDFTSKSVVSPRSALKIALLQNLSFNASWGVFRQQPSLLYLDSRASNRNLDPIRAEHSILGFSWYPQPDLMISIEGYRKNYSLYPVSVEYPTFSLANDGDSYTVNGRLIPLVSQGAGYAQGAEFFVQKKLSDALYGQLCYSWSVVRNRALDNVERPGSFDIPHVLYLIGGYKLNDNWEFSTKFSYASGRPRTPFLEPASSEQNRWISDVSRINAERVPDYSRLDIRVDNRHHFSGWNLVTYLEAQNILNRSNVFMYVWNEKTRNEEAVYQTGLFIVGGGKVEF